MFDGVRMETPAFLPALAVLRDRPKVRKDYVSSPPSHMSLSFTVLSLFPSLGVFFHCPPAEESGAELEPRKGYGKK